MQGLIVLFFFINKFDLFILQYLFVNYLIEKEEWMKNLIGMSTMTLNFLSF